jgi:RNA polymerase subunit RPABC4/transcription elongation factor Spt4
VLAVMFLLLASGFLAASGAANPAAATASPAASPTPAATPDLATHGDLVVSSGENYTIAPTAGSPYYYQGGNITVESGGTLYITNVTLEFVEFIGDSGTPIQRLAHIYSFNDEGTVNVIGSNVTTDMGVINAYAKLLVDVSGTMTVRDSHLLFPGWINVDGASAALTLNDSSLSGNPSVPGLVQPPVLTGDTEYAATLSATGGAQVNLFDSYVNETYADDWVVNGVPGPTPLYADNIVDTGAGVNVTDLQMANDSASLAQDWLYYPVAVPSGEVLFFYNSTTANTSVNVGVWYGGTEYSLGTVTLVNGTTAGVISIPFSSALLAAINAGGMLEFLNRTGAFDTVSQISIALSGATIPLGELSTGLILLNPALQYNLVASGAGTTVSSIDTAIDLTFFPTPIGPLSGVSPYPWLSNKLMFEDGAVGYLANLTVPTVIPGVFSASAVLADSTSTVNLYRWGEFKLTAVGEALDNATTVAYYAYNDNQDANATANALNDISTTSSAMWGYLQYWDHLHGAAHYGDSNAAGEASILLASTQITGATLPTGQFLGGYHLGFTPPSSTLTTWVSFGVSPYPVGVALGSAGYGQPDRTNVTVALPPAAVHILSITTPASPLNLGNIYQSTGVLTINGPPYATLTITATPVGGGASKTVASGQFGNGTFDLFWGSLKGLLSAGTSYKLVATADYRGATDTVQMGTVSVPSSPSTLGFLGQKFLGLPFWLWLVIAAVIAAAIVVVLLVFRRQAAGKLVECGECGELIPEDATVCPKCGAQFETDLVRCSRCSSTIPANSQFCPECSAQLLGKPGEGAADPERQAYADFTERFRAEAKKELGDNYTESAFWDWWKRQPSYVPFSQWKAQQTQGAPRVGMSQPPAAGETPAPPPPGATTGMPPKGGAGGAMTPPPAAPAPPPPPPAAGAAAPAAGASGLKPCPNCGKEIPPEYLVCPFCGAVTQ